MMAPSVALDEDGLVLAIGSAGGTRLRTALVTVASSILDEGLEPQAAVDRPRVHRAGDVVNAEPGVDEDALVELERRGLAVRRWPARHHYFGGVSLCSRERPGRGLEAERSSRELRQEGLTARSVASTSRAIWSTSACSLSKTMLVAQPLPQLDHEPLAVQVAGEAEQERLDAELVAAVVRVRPDRDRGAMAGGEPGVDPVQRDEQPRLGGDVRRREAERSPARVALHDHAVDLRRPAEERRRLPHLALVQQVADRRGRDALDLRDRPRVEAERRAGARCRRAAGGRSGSPRRRRRPACRSPPGTRAAKSSASSRWVSSVNSTTSVSSTPSSAKQLQPPLERAEELDPVAEHPPRVRVEGDDGRREPGLDRLRDHALMAAVDAVEDPERDRAVLALELGRRACDVQTGITTEPTATSRPSWIVRVSGAARLRPVRIASASPASTSTAGRKGSASAAGRIRWSSASSTENGPTSVRRSVLQWPPSASAIARTYVPEPTRRSRLATPSS